MIKTKYKILFVFYTKKLLNFIQKKIENVKGKKGRKEFRVILVHGKLERDREREWDGVCWWQTNVHKSTHHKLSVFNAGNGKIIKI